MMIKRPIGFGFLLVTLIVLAACDGAAQVAQNPPTATLAPVVSQTPRFTATPIPTRTPLPSQTFTSSPVPPTLTPSETWTPSPTPPVLGSVVSAQDVNVREGPAVQFPAIDTLRPGIGFEVLGFSEDGRWLNIRYERGDDTREGWISVALVRIQPTSTPIPTLTPTPNLTLLAEQSPLPTSLLGGQPITPTPPSAISLLTVTANPNATQSGGPATQILTQPTGVQLPNMAAIEQTATALANLGLPVLATSDRPLGGPTGGPLAANTPTTPPSGPAVTQNNVDVLAYCDDRSFGLPPPTNLAPGSTIDIYWSWYARTADQLRDHLDAAVYDIRLDGVPLTNWRSYAQPFRTGPDGNIYVDFFAPSQPLERGEHRITYSLTWTRAISDGYAEFGPGTPRVSETGTCTFTIR